MSGAVPLLPLYVFMVWTGHPYLFVSLFCHQSLAALRAFGVENFVLPGCCTGCVDTKQIGHSRCSTPHSDNDLSSTIENAQTKRKL
jgi:hypothetical protein